MLYLVINSNIASSSNSGTLLCQTVTNPREHVNAITTRSGKTCEEPSTPLVPTPVVFTPLKEPEQNPETSMDKVQKNKSGSFIHHEFAGELLTLPSWNDREHEDYLNRMTLLSKISISRSQENVHANQSLIIESLPVSLIPVEDSDPVQEEINIFLVLDDLIPPGVENDDSEDEDIELPNNDHQDDPSIPRLPPEPPDVEKCLKPEAGVLITKIFKGTDISKITRKQSKNEQTRTWETKEHKRSQAHGRGSKDGRDPKDFTGLSLDKPELLISSLEHKLLFS
ncbi:hypothetical protein Tco_1539319 [Tanacetum coccineum]